MLRNDLSGDRMPIPLTALTLRPDVMTLPPFSEIRTNSVQSLNQLDEMCFAGVTPVISAEPCEHILSAGRPINHQRSQSGVGEDQPNEIPFVRGYLLKIEKE